MKADDIRYWPVVGELLSNFRWFRKRCGGHWVHIHDLRYDGGVFWFKPYKIRPLHHYVWFFDVLGAEYWETNNVDIQA